MLFLTVSEDRLDTSVFWLCWSFTFPFNLAVVVGGFLWSLRPGSDLVKIPTVQALTLGFFAAYLVLGGVFMYLPYTSLTLPLILEAVLTAIYILVAMYAVFGATYISKNQRHVKSEVLFIRRLQLVVGDSVSVAEGELKEALSRYAENIRFSDPMSDASLDVLERQLMENADAIAAAIAAGDTAAALSLVAEGERALKRRNDRCIVLK